MFMDTQTHELLVGAGDYVYAGEYTSSSKADITFAEVPALNSDGMSYPSANSFIRLS